MSFAMRISSLHIHPVKGMRALDAARARVEPRGLGGDRRWLVVDPAGVFLTQRSHPRLATIDAALDGETLILATDAGASIRVDAPDGAERRRVDVWD
ncbi:MAG: MOSC N-terminal beta barrel domain-containing protein [Parvularculaceae bacterium]